MFAIFLLMLVLLFGLSVLTAFQQGYFSRDGAYDLSFKTEEFTQLQGAKKEDDYRLLADVLPTVAPDAAVRTDITAGVCLENDDSVSLQLGGDYSQRTNNYQRIFPDSCSAPQHEMLIGFYRLPDSVDARVQKPFQAVAPK